MSKGEAKKKVKKSPQQALKLNSKFYRKLLQYAESSGGEEALQKILNRIAKEGGLDKLDFDQQKKYKDYLKMIFEAALDEDEEIREIFLRIGVKNPSKLAAFLARKYPEKYANFLYTSWAIKEVLSKYIRSGGVGFGGGRFKKEESEEDDLEKRKQIWQKLLKDQDIKELLEQTSIMDYLYYFRHSFEHGKHILEKMIVEEDDEEIKDIIREVLKYYEDIEKEVQIDTAHDSIDTNDKTRQFPSTAVKRTISIIKKEKRVLVQHDPRTQKSAVGCLTPEFLGVNALHIVPAGGLENYYLEHKKYFIQDEEDLQKYSDPESESYNPDKKVSKRKVVVIRCEEDVLQIDEDTTDIIMSIGRTIKRKKRNGNGQTNGQEYWVEESENEEVMSDLLKRIQGKFTFSMVVLDEAHKFSRMESTRHKVAIKLLNEGINKPEYVALLTATPADNPDRLPFYASVLYPNLYPTPESAQKAFHQKAQLVKAAIDPKRVRCRDTDALIVPPSLMREPILIPLSPVQKVIYDCIQDSDLNHLQKIQWLMLVSQDPNLIKNKDSKYKGMKNENKIGDLLKDALRDFRAKKENNPELKFNNTFLVENGWEEVFLYVFFETEGNVQNFAEKFDETKEEFKKLWEEEKTLSSKYVKVLENIEIELESDEFKILLYSMLRQGVTTSEETTDEEDQDVETEVKITRSFRDLLSGQFPNIEQLWIDGTVSPYRTASKEVDDRTFIREKWRFLKKNPILLLTAMASGEVIDLTAPGARKEDCEREPEKYIQVPGKKISQHIIAPFFSRILFEQLIKRTQGDKQNLPVITHQYFTAEYKKDEDGNDVIDPEWSIEYGGLEIGERKRIFMDLLYDAEGSEGITEELLDRIFNPQKNQSEMSKYLRPKKKKVQKEIRKKIKKT